MIKGLFDTGEEENISCGRIVTVAFDAGADSVFDYLLPDKLGPVQPGQRVEVPFGRANKIVKGFCVQCREKADSQAQAGRKFKLKKVKSVIDDQP